MEDKNHISFDIRRLANLMKRTIDNNVAKHNLDIPTGIQSWVLHYLYNNQDKDIFQRNIEKKFSIRRSTATSMLQGMEKRGLIVRKHVDYDARLKKIILTPKAAKAIDTITQEILNVGDLITHNLTDQELDSFQIVLKKIIANVDLID